MKKWMFYLTIATSVIGIIPSSFWAISWASKSNGKQANSFVQLIFTGGDYSKLPLSGTAPQSQISWHIKTNEITFTCPSGYGLPNKAIKTVDFSLAQQLFSKEQNSLRSVTFETTSGEMISDEAFPSKVWMIRNHFVLAMSCIPLSKVELYS